MAVLAVDDTDCLVTTTKCTVNSVVHGLHTTNDTDGPLPSTSVYVLLTVSK